MLPLPAMPPQPSKQAFEAGQQAVPDSTAADVLQLESAVAPPAASTIPEIELLADSSVAEASTWRAKLPESIPLSSPPISSRYRRPHSPRWVIPVTAVLVFTLGLGGVTWWIHRPPSIGGEVTAQVIDDFEPEPVLVPYDAWEEAANDVQAALRSLERDPLVFTSRWIQLQVRGDRRGIWVSVRPGAEAAWFVVPTEQIPSWRQLIQQHLPTWARDRLHRLEEHLPAFLRACQLYRESRSSITRLNPFREKVLYPALVRGAGLQFAAQVGHTMHPCAFEDEQGHLYYLLPRETRAFRLSATTEEYTVDLHVHVANHPSDSKTHTTATVSRKGKAAHDKNPEQPADGMP